MASGQIGITAFGAYIPRLRLQRKSIAAAHAWANPGIVAQGKGERSMANWDEDAVTMAVEAARDCLPVGNDPIAARASFDALYFASTTMPFADRQNAGIVAAALTLPETIASSDVTGSQRAGTGALLAALSAVAGGAHAHAIVAAGDRRKTRRRNSGISIWRRRSGLRPGRAERRRKVSGLGVGHGRFRRPLPRRRRGL
jgi:3-hydroxy-3-methylglutaryl CoA synthase